MQKASEYMNTYQLICTFDCSIPSVNVAISAIHSISSPQVFLGPTESGLVAICHTKGNQNLHLILNGATNGPNYGAKYVNEAAVLFENEHPQMHGSIMVDCSCTLPFMLTLIAGVKYTYKFRP